MVWGDYNGVMGQSTKANSKTIRHMVKENSYLLAETCMTV